MNVAGFCFRPQHRLLQAAEYAGILGKHRVLRGALLELYFQPGATASSRLGLIIPKRHAALSVTRNYCKRVARELFRQRRPELPALDLVLRLSRPVKPAGREARGALGPALRGDFDDLLKRLPR